MYLLQEVLTSSRIHDPYGKTKMLLDGNVRAAVLRGRKMQSQAIWNAFVALGRAIGRLGRGFRRYLETQRAVAALQQMDPHTLADIGLTPSDIEFAVKRGRQDVTSVATGAQAPSAAANDPGSKPRVAA
jgi:uncharacterized protein YjiS (DUF1127 family)